MEGLLMQQSQYKNGFKMLSGRCGGGGQYVEVLWVYTYPLLILCHTAFINHIAYGDLIHFIFIPKAETCVGYKLTLLTHAMLPVSTGSEMMLKVVVLYQDSDCKLEPP